MKKVWGGMSVLLLVAGLVNPAATTPLLPEETQVIYLVNEERQALGLGPLWNNAQLYEAAMGHSLDMATNNFFSHTGSNGSTFVQRIQAEGYTGSPYGECIGMGYPTAEAMVDGWMNSPPHHDIIMSPSINRIGISHISSYWTLDVGYNGSADPEKPLVQVTNNSGAFDVAPQALDDGRILWQGWDGNDYEIYSQAPNQSAVKLTSNSSPDTMPQMNAAGQTVWMNWDGSDWEVWYNLGSGPVQLTNNAGAFDVLPQITVNRTTTQLTTNSLPDVAPQVNQTGQITWMQWDNGNWQVCYDVGSGPVRLTTTGNNQSPQIAADGQIYWQGWDGADFELYQYNPGSGVTKKLTNNAVDDVTPMVRNGVLVWSQWDGHDYEIYQYFFNYNLSRRLTNDDYDDQHPRVDATGRIVWMKWDGNDYEIYSY